MGYKYCKAIYKCRLCKERFEQVVYKVDENGTPSPDLCIEHRCNDGKYGVSDLLGAYEVE